MIFIKFERRFLFKNKKPGFQFTGWQKSSKTNEKNPVAVVQRCPVDKELKVSKNSQENTRAGVSFQQSYSSKSFSGEFLRNFQKRLFCETFVNGHF